MQHNDMMGIEAESSCKPEERSNGFVIKSVSSANISPVRDTDMRTIVQMYPEISEDEIPADGSFIIITEQAEKEIKIHVSWGKKTDENINEQGGILVGKVYMTDGRIVGVAEHAIPGELSKASAAYLEMGTETWVKMLNLFDDLYKDEGFVIIGWYHTHPNSLPVFMSSTDMGTQQMFFNQPWHFSVVMNPHKRIVSAFNSEDAIPCKILPSDYTEKKFKKE